MKSLKLPSNSSNIPSSSRERAPHGERTGLAPHQAAVLDSECDTRRIFLPKCRHVAAPPEPAPLSSVPLCSPGHVLISSLLWNTIPQLKPHRAEFKPRHMALIWAHEEQVPVIESKLGQTPPVYQLLKIMNYFRKLMSCVIFSLCYFCKDVKWKADSGGHLAVLALWKQRNCRIHESSGNMCNFIQ